MIRIACIVAVIGCSSNSRMPDAIAADAIAMIRDGRHHELRDRLRAAPPPRTEDERARRQILLARVLIDLAVAWNDGRVDDARAALADLAPVDPAVAAELVQVTGEVVFWTRLTGGGGDWDTIRSTFDRALAQRIVIGDRHGVAESMFYRGLVPQFTGNVTEARAYFERARDVAEPLGDPLLLSYPVRHLAGLDEEAGDDAAARRQHERSVALREQAGDALRLVNARLTLATFTCDRERACDRAKPQLERAREAIERLRLSNARIELARLDALVAEWEGNPGARDTAWARALQLATAARDAESVAAIRLDRALARLAVHDAGALDDARAAGHDAVIARAAVAAGDCATGTAALAHAETRSPQLELATADWVGRCLAVDATPWYRVAHASARSARDRRAELAALAELDPDAARELATRWRLPLALAP